MSRSSLLVAMAIALAEWQEENPGLSPPSAPLLDEPERLLKSIAQIEQLHITGVLSSVSDFSGYIEIQKAGWTLFLPYNLTIFFPFDDSLDGLIKLANEVRLGEKGVVCISGSATFMGAPFAISDLDFCEYIDSSCGQVVRRAEEIVGGHNSTPYCGAISWRADWDGPPWGKAETILAAARLELNNGGFSKGSRWKFDFVTDFGALGAMLVSNVGIPILASDIETWAEGLSWTAQEVPIVRSGPPPRMMAVRNRLGAYGKWLCGEIAELESHKPIKAAKRALSLANLLLLSEESDALIEALDDRELTDLVRRAALSEIVDFLPDPSVDRRAEALSAKTFTALTELGGKPDPRDYASVNQKCAKVLAQTKVTTDYYLGKARLALAGLMR